MTARAFLTVPEVADQLRLSEKTIRRLVLDGELPGVKVAGRLRLEAAGVDAFLARRRIVPATAPPPPTVPAAGRPGTMRAALAGMTAEGDR